MPTPLGKFWPTAGGAGAAGGAQAPASALTPGTNGQQVITSNSATTWADDIPPWASLLSINHIECVPRLLATNNPSWTSGDEYIGYFTAPFTTAVTKLGTIFIGAGATGSATIGKMALWTAGSDGSTTALVSGGGGSNDTAMGSATGTYEQTIASTITAGTRYAILAIIVHTYTTAPKVAATAAFPAGQAVPSATPRFSSKVTGLSDVSAAAVAAGALSNNLNPLYLYVR